MTAPFAAIETATAANAVAALANVSAVVDGVTVDGIFDNAYGDAFGVAGSVPTLSCASDDIDAAHGDAVTIGATSYTITNVEPDGTGMTRLTLQEA